MLLQQNLEVYLFLGVEVPVQVVPQGIESVNGSNINMGCASPLVDRGGVMVCNNSESYLVDGCSPTIDISTSNWASQLVTVRRNKANDVINVEHVVLTLYFDKALSPDSIELDLFLCPHWNISALYILIFAYQNSTLELSSVEDHFIKAHRTEKSSCDSLSTVSIIFDQSNKEFHSWHILIEFLTPGDIGMYVGEIRFLRNNIPNPGK